MRTIHDPGLNSRPESLPVYSVAGELTQSKLETPFRAIAITAPAFGPLKDPYYRQPDLLGKA
jgi:hypothetical protein